MVLELDKEEKEEDDAKTTATDNLPLSVPKGMHGSCICYSLNFTICLMTNFFFFLMLKHPVCNLVIYLTLACKSRKLSYFNYVPVFLFLLNSSHIITSQ